MASGCARAARCRCAASTRLSRCSLSRSDRLRSARLARRLTNTVTSIVMVIGRLAMVAAIVILAALVSAPARVPQRHCQQTIARVGRRLLDESLASLESCQRRIVRGALPTGSDCLTARATVRGQAAEMAGAARALRRACSDADVVSLAPAGACTGARRVADLTTCLASGAAGAAETLVAVSAADRMALPRASRRCATQASLQARRFALDRLLLIQRCKHSAARLDLPPGATCATEPKTQARIDERRTRAAGRIASACSAAVLPTVPFGAPCDASAGGDALAACLLGQAAVAADD